jgi:hypothetical protein|tara:strand:- start:99 stop:287 length:189 start_codon:yes stop_codon:yes gene_type:complete
MGERGKISKMVGWGLVLAHPLRWACMGIASELERFWLKYRVDFGRYIVYNGRHEKQEKGNDD